MANPFVFGEILTERSFVDREEELRRLVRDLRDCQKIFLLSPRRFGKSSLVAMAFSKLQRHNIRTVTIPVSSYSTYSQFLEKFAERVLRAAGPWDRVRSWVSRFTRRVQPEATYNMSSGEVSVALGRADRNPEPLAPDIFALPGELARNAGFKMVICFDEFQKIQDFNGGSVEEALRNEVQRQREVGYVFAGSQPTWMEQMLSAKRPFHKAGPRMFLEKIPSTAWQEFIIRQFRRTRRAISESAMNRLLGAADLIPYDVQRLAHELWDYSEISGRRALELADVNSVIAQLVAEQSPFYERQWQQLSSRQRALLQALSATGSDDLLSEATRTEFRLGPASSAQKALQALMAQDYVDRYHGRYFLLDPLFGEWIEKARL